MTTTTIQQSIEPLVAGDRLTREEFIRRWEAMPGLKRAELIGGRVYMPSPLKAKHGDSDFVLSMALGVYAASTPGCIGSNNATCFVGEDSPQPDIHLRIMRECGGRSWEGEDEYIHGSPELVAEVCLSSEAYDLHDKKDLYSAEGIEEYVALVLSKRELRMYRLAGKQYDLETLPADGIIRSRVFPGLWLDSRAIVEKNGARALDVLNSGLRSPEHESFVKLLASKKSSK